ncbi:MAG TPA: M1 family metallopeptidase [Gemmatimonadaceae bacterium]|nr:M1 family metallopeptidase [Gemmatimonadaceae bacterium]
MTPNRTALVLAGALSLAAALPAPADAQAPTAAGLYQPRTIRATYRKGTRSMDGRPGPTYWQNHASYRMTVTALPPDRIVRGTEEITYHNNSPDTLKSLIARLMVNIHKPGAPRAGTASADYLTDGVHIDAYTVDGRAVAFVNNPQTSTIARWPLATPLLPRDSVHLSIEWHYEISKEAGREGMLDATTYYLAYFYPRVAVYDDYNGWDTMPFLDAQEFYNDFNDYDVTVRVPAGYGVWGTGTLTNAGDVLQPAALQRYTASLTADTVIHVATAADLKARRVYAGTGVTAWHFTARNITDMTFNVSDHYVWDASSVVVDTATGRRASVQSAFNDDAADFHHMVSFGRHSLDWLSRNWPGVPYPFEKTTIVQGGADMEYPMMVNDGSNADTVFSRFVVEHEIAHTWFPFYMGINESRYAMMDEGWATTFEYLIGTADLGAKRATDFYKQFRVEGWINDPSPLEDLPIVTPEDGLTAGAWGNNAYGKASLGYLALKDLLGDALFKSSLHEFMARWNGKHPIPWDYFYTVNDATKRNLDWFWNAWYFSNGYIDFAIADAKKASGGYAVTLDNLGGFPAPVDLVVTYADSTTETFHQTPGIWEQNLKRATVRIPVKKTVAGIAMEHSIWMDADTTNDHWAPPKR